MELVDGWSRDRSSYPCLARSERGWWWRPRGVFSLLRHLTYFQIRARSSVCTNRGILKKYITVFRIFLLRSIALACLLRYTHFGFTEMFHLRIIVVSSQSFFYEFSDFGCRYRQHFLPVFGLLVHIPTALFGWFRQFDEPTGNTFQPFW